MPACVNDISKLGVSDGVDRLEWSSIPMHIKHLHSKHNIRDEKKSVH